MGLQFQRTVVPKRKKCVIQMGGRSEDKWGCGKDSISRETERERERETDRQTERESEGREREREREVFFHVLLYNQSITRL